MTKNETERRRRIRKNTQHKQNLKKFRIIHKEEKKEENKSQNVKKKKKRERRNQGRNKQRRQERRKSQLKKKGKQTLIGKAKKKNQGTKSSIQNGFQISAQIHAGLF